MSEKKVKKEFKWEYGTRRSNGVFWGMILLLAAAMLIISGMGVNLVNRLTVWRILLGAVGNALRRPVGKIVFRRGPNLIAQHAERVAALLIVTSKQVNPIAEHMGFTVGNVCIERQKRIKRHLFHSFSPFVRMISA